MAIVRYKKYHYKAICSWYKARKMEPPPEESLSDLGFIADNRVAGWLYITNSNVALIEGMISNPFTIPSLRHQSAKKLASTLVDTAYAMGYTTIKVDTIHPSVEKIAKELGFKEYNLKTLILTDDTRYEPEDTSDAQGSYKALGWDEMDD